MGKGIKQNKGKAVEHAVNAAKKTKAIKKDKVSGQDELKQMLAVGVSKKVMTEVQQKRKMKMKQRRRETLIKNNPTREVKPAALVDKQIDLATKFLAKPKLSRGQRKRL